MGAIIETLYDLDLMPPNLRAAHRALDGRADRLYRKDGFATDRERVERLLGLHEASAAPLLREPRCRRAARAGAAEARPA